MDRRTWNRWPCAGLLVGWALATAVPQHVLAGPAERASGGAIQAREVQDGTVRTALRAVKRATLPVPVEVVIGLDGFSNDVVRQIRAADACAFALTPARDRIFVLASCNDYVAARDGNRFGLLRLAAVIEHEIAHIEGADELGALEAQLKAAERIQRSAATTAEMLNPFLLYRTAIKRRIAELRGEAAR